MTSTQFPPKPSIMPADVSGMKLCVCTPMYGNMCSGNFTAGMVDLATMCTLYNVELQFLRVGNESLIQRARNNCAHIFMKTGCDYLMFIDGDIAFSAKEVITMLYLMKTNDSYDVLTGAYPKKNINWNNIKKAVQLGVGSKKPLELELFVGNFVVNFIGKGITSKTDLNVPLEVAHAGTGFMLIRKSVFERFTEAYPDMYCIGNIEAGSEKIFLFFECGVDPKTRIYLSEDYMFCHRIRELGMKVFLCPWVVLSHEGSFTFYGGLQQHLAAGTEIKQIMD